jgi:hypothetical protein
MQKIINIKLILNCSTIVAGKKYVSLKKTPPLFFYIGNSASKTQQFFAQLSCIKIQHFLIKI